MDTLTWLVNFTIVNVENMQDKSECTCEGIVCPYTASSADVLVKDLDYFKHLLSDEQFKSCALKSTKTWYPLTKELMVSFIFQVGVIFRNL